MSNTTPDKAQSPGDCPFCATDDDGVLLATPLVYAKWDRFPVSPGHALLITKRHIPDWWSATDAERQALLEQIVPLRRLIEAHHRPDGYNIGVNIGPAGGQTVPHLHVHLIPRFAGDVGDPTGGVRSVIPAKANYLAAQHDHPPHRAPLVRGGTDDPLLPHLLAHLAQAATVEIAVAFVSWDGVGLLLPHLADVLARGGTIRLLTGDYLGFTDPDALRRLGDLGAGLELRVIETRGGSFHVKGYICVTPHGGGTAFVGSSNLTRVALERGVEWNYRVVTPRDAEGHRAIRDGFRALWDSNAAVPVTEAWLRAYESRRQPPAAAAAASGPDQPEPPPPVPTPHEVQRAALEALADSRATGNVRGLVVLATGLGKTWLAAFDTERVGARRVLFIAHREEILDQALQTFRRTRPHARLGRYTGTEKVPDADVLFASVQTLHRRTHLERFAPDAFDYVVVDEFHHASAATYRRLLAYFTPRYLLGLTATPERTDGADLLALCGEEVVYRCDLVEGIRRGLLAPFAYYGVPDDVDYQQIPWRSTRFDEEALTSAVATVARADNALEQLNRRGGTRTLGFCVSQRHADFMAAHAAVKGLRTAAVHAGPSSDPRALSLERLVRGELDVIFAVDMFNEGVDLPDVDTVLMLRPTESAVVWLQQFGRGLRLRPGKTLKVIDYIGNHRSFLLKPRTLFGLDEGDAHIDQALRLVESGRGSELLPPGCSVTYDLEARDIIRQLLKPTNDGIRQFYEDFRNRHGTRPTASESFHAFFDPRTVRKSHGSWLQFVRAMGDLRGTLDEAETLLRPLLQELEVTPMTKAYKMIVLLAMLEEDALVAGLDVEQLAHRVRLVARRYAVTRDELDEVLEDDAALVASLERNPIAAWAGGRGTGGTPYFGYADRRFVATLDIPTVLRAAANVLIGEVAEWRLAAYLRRASMSSGADRIVCKVSHSGGRPILFLPPRDSGAEIPEGWVDVRVGDEPLQAKFVKIAVNVVQGEGSDDNRLPEILTGWFGTSAGAPGTQQRVIFRRDGTTYRLEPLGDDDRGGLTLWAKYSRADVPRLLGIELKGFENQQGIVERKGLAVLFVTLDKSGSQEAHKYRDDFLSDVDFQWQSQNRTSQGSPTAQRLREHRERGITVHLFVRRAAKVNGRTQPFSYCGELDFQRWEGENPITMWWKLRTPLSPDVSAELRAAKTHARDS